MPSPIVGLVGAQIGGSLLGARAQSRAASDASDAQVQAAQLSVEEQRRQFDAIQELLSPYVGGGTDAFNAMAELTGLRGAAAQQQQISAIEQSPELAARVQAGEEAILQNAAATGGLRGGNTQAALAQFRPQMLAEQIGTQYSRLGGLSQIGQASAAQQAAAGQNFAAGASQAYGQMGAARAGAAMARGAATQNAIAGVTGGIGQLYGSGFMQDVSDLYGPWGF